MPMLDSLRRVGDRVRILRLFSPGRLLLAATMVIAGYFIFSASVNLVHSFHLAGDQSRLQDDVEELRQQQDQLQQIRDYLRTDEYVEFMARRVFGLVRPGEVLVTVDAPTPPAVVNNGLDGKWWQRLFGRDSAPARPQTEP